jgi:hypothetical protein
MVPPRGLIQFGEVGVDLECPQALFNDVFFYDHRVSVIIGDDGIHPVQHLNI